MGKFVKKIFKKISDWYAALILDVKDFIPIAINIVESIKKITDSQVDDVIAIILKSVIPGITDDIIIDKVKTTIEKWVPIILIQLKTLNVSAPLNNSDILPSEIIVSFNKSNKIARDSFYHNFATLILEKLTDDKLSKSECIILTEYYYTNKEMENTNNTITDKFIDSLIDAKVKVKIPFSIFKKGSIKKLFNKLKKKINL